MNTSASTSLTAKPATRPPLKALDEALAELLGRATPLAGSEAVSTFDADGRVLAQDVISALQVPPEDKRLKTERLEYPSPQGTGTMKGYLVRPAGAARQSDSSARRWGSLFSASGITIFRQPVFR